MARVTFNIQELNELIKNRSSGVTLVTKCTRQLVASFYQLTNLKQYITDYLYSTIAKYDSQLDAVILSYQKVGLLEDFTVRSDGKSKIRYTADIYVFKPKIGSILSGTVNKKSKDHIGCLVHKVFNVAIPKPTQEDSATWIGSNVEIGDTVQFKVIDEELNEVMPYIKAELINSDREAMSDNYCVHDMDIDGNSDEAERISGNKSDDDCVNYSDINNGSNHDYDYTLVEYFVNESYLNYNTKFSKAAQAILDDCQYQSTIYGEHHNLSVLFFIDLFNWNNLLNNFRKGIQLFIKALKEKSNTSVHKKDETNIDKENTERTKNVENIQPIDKEKCVDLEKERVKKKKHKQKKDKSEKPKLKDNKSDAKRKHKQKKISQFTVRPVGVEAHQSDLPPLKKKHKSDDKVNNEKSLLNSETYKRNDNTTYPKAFNEKKIKRLSIHPDVLIRKEVMKKQKKKKKKKTSWLTYDDENDCTADTRTWQDNKYDKQRNSTKLSSKKNQKSLCDNDSYTEEEINECDRTINGLTASPKKRDKQNSRKQSATKTLPTPDFENEWSASDQTAEVPTRISKKRKRQSSCNETEFNSESNFQKRVQNEFRSKLSKSYDEEIHEPKRKKIKKSLENYSQINEMHKDYAIDDVDFNTFENVKRKSKKDDTFENVKRKSKKDEDFKHANSNQRGSLDMNQHDMEDEVRKLKKEKRKRKSKNENEFEQTYEESNTSWGGNKYSEDLQFNESSIHPRSKRKSNQSIDFDHINQQLVEKEQKKEKKKRKSKMENEYEESSLAHNTSNKNVEDLQFNECNSFTHSKRKSKESGDLSFINQEQDDRKKKKKKRRSKNENEFQHFEESTENLEFNDFNTSEGKRKSKKVRYSLTDLEGISHDDLRKEKKKHKKSTDFAYLNQQPSEGDEICELRKEKKRRSKSEKDSETYNASRIEPNTNEDFKLKSRKNRNSNVGEDDFTHASSYKETKTKKKRKSYP